VDLGNKLAKKCTPTGSSSKVQLRSSAMTSLLKPFLKNPQCCFQKEGQPISYLLGPLDVPPTAHEFKCFAAIAGQLFETFLQAFILETICKSFTLFCLHFIEHFFPCTFGADDVLSFLNESFAYHGVFTNSAEETLVVPCHCLKGHKPSASKSAFTSYGLRTCCAPL